MKFKSICNGLTKSLSQRKDLFKCDSHITCDTCNTKHELLLVNDAVSVLILHGISFIKILKLLLELIKNGNLEECLHCILSNLLESVAGIVVETV